MADLNLEALLAEISPDAPCGVDLEYDPEFQALERSAEGIPEQKMVNSSKPPEEPDWKAVRDHSLHLMKRTHDIRVGVYLTRALGKLEGLNGLRQGFALIKGYLENHWDEVHPQTDDGDLYPITRMNALATFNDRNMFLNPLKSTPLTDSRTLGRFSLRDIEIATGKLTPPGNKEEIPKSAEIEAAFMDTALESIEANSESAESVLADIHAIHQISSDRAGAVNAPDFSALIPLMRELTTELNKQIQKRGGNSSDKVADEGGAADAVGGQIAAPAGMIKGIINNRQDVDRALGEICQYFERNDPSSPIPFLLKRAQRLLFKDFREILEDLAPDGMKQAENIFGAEKDKGK